MGWYVVIKTIKGHRYYYRQRTWREGPKVRCESIYIGPVDGGVGDARVMPVVAKPVTTTAHPRQPGVLREEGEAAFVQELLHYQGDRRWARSYAWSGASRRTAPALPDTGVLTISQRLGVRIGSMIRAAGNGAPHYDPVDEAVWLPDPGRYRDLMGCSAERLYTIDLLHELAHATMKRLGRQRHWQSFSDSKRIYYREELVAELTANMVARRLGIEPENSALSASYLTVYRKQLPRSTMDADVAWAIAEAKRAAALLLSLHGGLHPRVH